MKASALFAAIVALLIGGIVFVFVGFQDGGKRKGLRIGPGSAEASCNQDGLCLPKITMMDELGTAWTPESLEGKVVIVNVWATWCRPCQAEIPDLTKIWDKYEGKDVVLIGLLNDGVDQSSLDRFISQYQINYPVVRMDDELYTAFHGPDTLPTTFIYDRNGHQRFGRPGVVHERQLSATLDELLAEARTVKPKAPRF